MSSFFNFFFEIHPKRQPLNCYSFSCFNDLKDNGDGFRSDPQLDQLVRRFASKLSDSTQISVSEGSYENILHLYGVWQTNSFGVANENDTKIIGSALYVLSSSYDHSCRPNALRVEQSGRMQVIFTSCDGNKLSFV